MKNLNDAVSGFRNLIEGPVILPGESGYNESRAIWNGMFDKRPAIIVRCMQASDEGPDCVKEAYTEEVWKKLVEAKNQWDPENVFRMNQNIAPTV